MISRIRVNPCPARAVYIQSQFQPCVKTNEMLLKMVELFMINTEFTKDLNLCVESIFI